MIDGAFSSLSVYNIQKLGVVLKGIWDIFIFIRRRKYPVASIPSIKWYEQTNNALGIEAETSIFNKISYWNYIVYEGAGLLDTPAH